jgi:hypothetical protein
MWLVNAVSKSQIQTNNLYKIAETAKKKGGGRGVIILCNHIASGLNLFSINNNICLAISVIPFQVVSLGYYPAISATCQYLKYFLKCVV